jgi:isopenicillin-N N-acyltransferase-like protein
VGLFGRESSAQDYALSSSLLAYIVADLGLQAALETYYYMTKPYTGAYVYQELQGIADASGVAFSRIMQIQLLGEITKGRCSMFGAWGASVPSGLLQLRALDWDVEGPYKDHALIVVYHADNVNNYPNSFINVGFVGWVGSISGMSSNQVAISEIGVSFPDDTFGNEDPFGIPFVFLLRDVLQYDATLDDALNRMMNAQRTVHLILGVGDGKIESFRSIQYSHSIMRIMDDQNMMPYNTTWHPRIKDIVYYGMDWICPGYNAALAGQIRKFYGNITAENTISDILPIVQTGDLHAAIYDLVNMQFWVAFAAPSFSNDPNKLAYNRQYTHYDARKLFNEPRP